MKTFQFFLTTSLVCMSVCNAGCVWVFWYTSRCVLWNFQKVWRGLCWGNCELLITRTLQNWWSCSLVSCQHYIKHFVRTSTIVNLYCCALWLLTETFSSMLPLQEMLQTSLFFVLTSITSLISLDPMELCWYCLPFFWNDGLPYLFVALRNSLLSASNYTHKYISSGRNWDPVRHFSWSACNANRSRPNAVFFGT